MKEGNGWLSYRVGIGGGNSGEIERLPEVADVKVYVPRVIALGKDVGPQKEEIVMATKIGINFTPIGRTVW